MKYSNGSQPKTADSCSTRAPYSSSRENQIKSFLFFTKLHVFADCSFIFGLRESPDYLIDAILF